MKLFNSKFKSLGYEHVPEASSAGYDEYVKHEDGHIKKISIEYGGDDDLIIIYEQIRNAKGEWTDVPSTEMSAQEWDAIKTFCEEKGFGGNIRWVEENGCFSIRGLADENN